MNHVKYGAAVLLCALLMVPGPAAAEKLGSGRDKQSYSVGLNAGRNMKRSIQSLPIQIEMEKVRKGVDDALSGAKPKVSDEEQQAVLADIQRELAAKQHGGAPQDPKEKKGKGSASADKEKRGYSIGMNAGRNMKRSMQAQSFDLDLALVRKGIDDAFADAKPLLSDDEVQAVLAELQKEIADKQKVVMEKAKKEGEEFLAQNKKHPGVKTLPSGLQYNVLAEGKGKSPKPTDTVQVHYRGTLVNGTEFDSSYKRGQPASFPVNGVIKGWTEALQLMKEGSKWQLFIPSDLAYGERGMGAQIGPNAVLIFEVELISVGAQ